MSGRNSGPARVALLILAGAIAGCGGDGGGGGGGPTGGADVTGIVTGTPGGAPIQGAVVSIGSAQATTDASGAYALNDVPEGNATLRSTAAGFQDYETAVTLASGSNEVNFGMARQEIFSVSSASLYAPAAPAQLRGVIVALGGPKTRGMVNGERMIQIGESDALEAQMQAFAASVRQLAADSQLAVFGTNRTDMEDAAASDQSILDAISSLAAASGRPELATAPLILVGMRPGATTVWGLTNRNAARIAGAMYLKPILTQRVAPPTWTVPASIWLMELDDFTPAPDYMGIFSVNRAEHALWSGGVEPGIETFNFTTTAQTATVAWMRAIIGTRFPATAGGPLRTVAEDAGWLGNVSTGEIAPYGAFTGNALEAAWLPSESAAQAWKVFVGH